MSSYYFATFHQKKTMPPTCAKTISTPKDLRDATSISRVALMQQFERIYNNPRQLANDATMQDVHNAAESYLRWCVKLIEAGYRNDLYCYWGESLCPKTNHAFNDLHYDMANVQWNLAVVELNHANHILTHCVNQYNLDQMEKQAYNVLSTAAGRFQLCRELVSTVSTVGSDGESNNYLLADITPDFLEMMEKIALAQAQEIGASKAHRKDDDSERKAKDGLTAKLTHQCHVLYQEAATLATRKVVCPSDKFAKLIIFLELKSAVYEGLTYAYAASNTYDDKPEDALWMLNRSKELFAPCRAMIERGKFDHYISSFIDGAERTQYRIVDRIESMNRLVVRAKPSESSVPLPPPQVLARVKEVTLPEAASLSKEGMGDWDMVHGEKNGSGNGTSINSSSNENKNEVDGMPDRQLSTSPSPNGIEGGANF